MKKYFLLSWKKGKEPLASAFAPKESKLGQDLISAINGTNMLPFELSLVKLDVGKNGLIESNDLSDLKEIWLDYQPNSLAWKNPVPLLAADSAPLLVSAPLAPVWL